MSQYFLSSTAEKDINEIITYLAKENANTARKFLDSLHQITGLIAENPLMGHTKEDLTSRPVRFYTLKWHYLFIYKLSSPLEIVRVLSGYRDIVNLLNDEF